MNMPACAPEASSPLQQHALTYFDQAARQMGLDPEVRSVLASPRRTVIVSCPIRRDDGQVQVFSGYRVQYNDALGPFAGGVCFQPDLTLSQVTALAMLQTWKHALLGLPLGGAAGGVACDPATLSAAEKQRLARRYAAELFPAVGRLQDRPAPDTGTDAQIMAWYLDTCSAMLGYPDLACVSGRPAALGGTLLTEQAAGCGMVHVLAKFLTTQQKDISDVRIAIQGFGKVGLYAASLLDEHNARIIALSTRRGGIYNDDGLDIQAAVRFYRDNGSLEEFPDGEQITNEELLTCPCDVLIAAAADSTIDRSVAPHVQAHTIVEAAHGPVTPEADLMLRENGVTVLPDILASGGAAVAGYLECAAGFPTPLRTTAELSRQIRTIMEQAFERVNAKADEADCDYRSAAYYLALAGLADACRLRGIFP